MSKAGFKIVVQPQDEDPHLNQQISNFHVFLITAFGGLLFGYDCIIGRGLVEVERFKADFGTPQLLDGKLGFSDALRGGMVSILSCGTFLGALSTSQFCVRWGRSRGMMITCVISLLV